MKIIKITINNFKSIGETNNTIFLANGVTTLIGKNESGKSNVLDAISYIQFQKKLAVPPQFKHQTTDSEISYRVVTKILSSEAPEFALHNGGETTFHLTTTGITYEGVFSELFTEGTKIYSLVRELDHCIKEGIAINSKTNGRQQRNDLFSHTQQLIATMLQLHTNIIFINNISTYKNELTSIMDTDLSKKSLDIFDNIHKEIIKIYSLLPIIYKYKEVSLKDSYTHDDISKLQTDKKLHIELQALFKVANIKPQLLQEIISTNNHPGKKNSAIKEINRMINENINDKFNQFYGQNKLNLQLAQTDNKKINFLVEYSEKLSLHLSEQSHGLKWYFNFFLDILSENLVNKPVLYLIDEPGVHLHVDAQKALLELFEYIVTNDCNIIYSTHSPFMLNQKQLCNTRVIQKKNEFTDIINKYYSDHVDGHSKLETLSPLLKGIGANLSNAIFPLYDKPSLITEGITDKLYLEAMLTATNYCNHSYYILPSIGVSNINLLASVFLGWGIDFKVLLDYDKAGFNEYKILTNKLGIHSDNIFFVNLKNYSADIEQSEYETIESLIKDDLTMIKMPDCHGEKNHKESKMIVAQEFNNKVLGNEITISDATKERFTTLFKAIFPKDKP